MNTISIASLSQRFPNMIPVALDARNIMPTTPACEDDIYSPAPIVRTHKPRSRDAIVLTNFDTDLEMFFHVENKTVYYLPNNQHSAFATQIARTADRIAFVTAIVKDALKQSLDEQGDMCVWETRMFWATNDEAEGCAPAFVTVVREMREYRIAAEIGRSESCPCPSLFSLRLLA